MPSLQQKYNEFRMNARDPEARHRLNSWTMQGLLKNKKLNETIFSNEFHELYDNSNPQYIGSGGRALVFTFTATKKIQKNIKNSLFECKEN